MKGILQSNLMKHIMKKLRGRIVESILKNRTVMKKKTIKNLGLLQHKSRSTIHITDTLSSCHTSSILFFLIIYLSAPGIH